MQSAWLTVSFVKGLSLVVLGMLGVWVVSVVMRKTAQFRVKPRKSVAPVQSPPKYRMEPFPDYGKLLTLAEFQDLLKKYAMDSDNGTSIWASAHGYWVDAETGAWVRVNVGALRAGEKPEPCFTHIWFLAK